MTTHIESLFPAGPDDIPEAYRVDPEQNPPVYLIDGKVETFSGAARPVHSRIAYRGSAGPEPILLGYEPQLTVAEAERAVAAAEKAWGRGAGPWPEASPEARVKAVERFATALEAERDRVATLLMYEIGKPLGSARKEVMRSAAYIRDTIEVYRELIDCESHRITGKKGSTDHYAHEVRQPLGGVLCVAPFNYPVNEFLTTVVPALLMGNVVIAKTPRFGALANQVLARAFADCFPPGAVSLLPGDGRVVIPPVMKATWDGGPGQASRGLIDVLAFIGSEGAANAIIGQHPSPTTLHLILGLGAKNAAVLLPGADSAEVAGRTVKGALGFNGQRCTAEKIFFVPRDEAEVFARAMAEKVNALSFGMPWDDVAISPLPEPEKIEWMREYVDDALRQGAQVVNEGGGEAFHSLMRPAVLYPVTPEMRIYHEEQFGPIVPIAPYDHIEEVYAWQRASPYGQQAGVWGPEDAIREVAWTFAAEVARVNLNDVCQRGPDSFGFTATDKSGFGVLSLRDALISFSRPVLIQSTSQSALDGAMK